MRTLSFAMALAMLSSSVAGAATLGTFLAGDRLTEGDVTFSSFALTDERSGVLPGSERSFRRVCDTI